MRTWHSRYPNAHRPALAQARRPRAAPARAAPQPSPCAPAAELLERTQAVSDEWLRSDTARPLSYTSDTGATCRVTLLGVVPYAPLQADFVAEVVRQSKPELVLIDQPQGSASDVCLPHPKWIQVLLDQQDAAAPDELRRELQQAQIHAKIGRDILDPFETFGFYTGTDFVKCAAHIPHVLSAMGYLPGQEYAAAVRAARDAGAQVECIDAPLKLQEVWVSRLVREFAVTEAQLAVQLNRAVDANAADCDPLALDWEARTGEWAVAQGDEELVESCDKACKAAAAALLGPDQLAPVLRRSAQLQPLKFRHFAQRELHMARQLLDACMRQAGGYSATIRRLAAAATAADGQGGAEQGAAAAPAARHPSSSSSNGGGGLEWVDPTGGSGLRHELVVVVARHHLPGIRALWEDPCSALWRGQVTREFSPSAVGCCLLLQPPAGIRCRHCPQHCSWACYGSPRQRRAAGRLCRLPFPLTRCCWPCCWPCACRWRSCPTRMWSTAARGLWARCPGASTSWESCWAGSGLLLRWHSCWHWRAGVGRRQGGLRLCSTRGLAGFSLWRVRPFIKRACR
jgi:hypothetical protein